MKSCKYILLFFVAFFVMIESFSAAKSKLHNDNDEIVFCRYGEFGVEPVELKFAKLGSDPDEEIREVPPIVYDGMSVQEYMAIYYPAKPKYETYISGTTKNFLGGTTYRNNYILGSRIKMSNETQKSFFDEGICPNYVRYDDSFVVFGDGTCACLEMNTNDGFCAEAEVNTGSCSYTSSIPLTYTLETDMDKLLADYITSIRNISIDGIKNIKDTLENYDSSDGSKMSKAHRYILEQVFGFSASDMPPAFVGRYLGRKGGAFYENLFLEISDRIDVLLKNEEEQILKDCALINFDSVEQADACIEAENAKLRQTEYELSVLLAEFKVLSTGYIEGLGLSPQIAASCDNILRPGIKSFLVKMFSLVKYAVPLIIIVMTIIEYLKAVVSQESDMIKKVTQDFGKRLLIAAIIFVVPTLLQFVLNLLDYPYCSIFVV